MSGKTLAAYFDAIMRQKCTPVHSRSHSFIVPRQRLMTLACLPTACLMVDRSIRGMEKASCEFSCALNQAWKKGFRRSMDIKMLSVI